MLRHVLLIDDHDADLVYGEAVLRRSGLCAQVSCFEDAEEALAFLMSPEGRRVDLVLLDINMPDMDGFTFLAAYGALRAEAPARAGVVMLTSSPDPLDRERAFAHRCVKDYLIKPLDAAAVRRLAEPAACGAGTSATAQP
ncbi:MAG TPA: response regulator [Methylibium sp.]|uniref:response regulator n=1 Tax=Methylibium sp. TaxID=2067992 RepID=UPI002DB947D4|nr:response regulator [Methylibium sp.]HEU4457988.1 response regulator [Methylibium sp.]